MLSRQAKYRACRRQRETTPWGLHVSYRQGACLIYDGGARVLKVQRLMPATCLYLSWISILYDGCLIRRLLVPEEVVVRQLEAHGVSAKAIKCIIERG